MTDRQPVPGVHENFAAEAEGTPPKPVGWAQLYIDGTILDFSDDPDEVAGWEDEGLPVKPLFEHPPVSGVASTAPPPPSSLMVVWHPIATADKNQERLTLGIFRSGKLEEIHVGGYRHALNDDEESCWWSDQCDDEIVPTHWMPDLSASSVTPAPNAVGPFSDVAGFGASYQREGDQWIVYTMPGAKRIGSIDGYDKTRLDWVVEALRAAHAQGSEFSSWVPPTGTKRAIVEELWKARSSFMINDFEIADRMMEAIRRLAAEEVQDNTPAPQPKTVGLTAEQERLRFEGDLDKWMKIIGAGIAGSQPEAYALMDLACHELVKLRAILAYLNENVALELVWQEVNGDPSECGWHVFRRFGGRSDRDYKIAGTGETVEEAIKHAMERTHG